MTISERAKLIDNTAPKKEEVTKDLGKKYIVPPGLLKKMFEFHSLIETCEGAPILLTGPTGVGKSLFIHMYREWIKKKKKIDGKKINTVNCSHFDKSLSRSELFGHEKGAFTGADNRKDGWIAQSKDGVLILEEIGELPLECQAQLLTFIEDGKYHTVGGTEIKDGGHIAILGATNKKSDEMREDFWNRFINFSIPPLYQRRHDILYYVASKYPEIIKELQPWETLSLLAYNWPGNIREIDRVIRSIKAAKYLRKENPFQDDVWGMLFDVSNDYSGLSPQYADRLFNDLNESGFDVDQLEAFLNKRYVGLCTCNEANLFETSDSDHEYLSHKLVMHFGVTNLFSFIKKEDEIAIIKKYESLFNVEIPAISKPFFMAQIGYEIFCLLFFQNPTLNSNCLDVYDDFTPFTKSYAYSLLQEEDLEMLHTLARQVFKYLSNIELTAETKLPMDYLDEVSPSRGEVLLALANQYPENEFLAHLLNLKPTTNKQDSKNDILKMKEADLLRWYYEELYEQHEGVITKIADISGKDKQTVYGKYRRMGFSIK